jgi:competence protein ComEC
VPPLAWLAAGGWVAALAAEELSWRTYATGAAPALPWAAAVTAVLAAAVVLRLGRAAAVRFAALGLAAGMLVATSYWTHWRGDASALATTGAREYAGEVVEDPQPARGGCRLRIRLDGGRTATVTWPSEPTPANGARVSFRSVLRPLPPGDPYSRTAARRGDSAEGRAWAVSVLGWREGPVGALLAMRARVLRVVEHSRGPGADLFASIVLGDRRRVAGSAAEQDFRATGLGHVLAASALYVGLVYAAARTAVRRSGMGPRWQLALGLGVALAYACVGGSRASMVRGLLVCAVSGAASLSGRRHDALSSAALAVTFILAEAPAAAFDLGLALGVAVVAGLAVFGRLARAWVTAVLPDALRTAAPALSSAVVAQLSALPLVAGTFGMVSLLGPVSVIVVVPLLALALLAGVSGAVTALVVPRLAPVALGASYGVFAAAAAAAHVLASVPGSAVALGPFSAPAASGFVAAAASVWLLWPQPKKRRRARWASVLLAALIAARLAPLPVSGARLVVMDVGQGDAILVRDGGATMLVDCGPNPAALRAALARQKVRRVDCVVLTHAHADHTGGLPGLAGVTTVGWVGSPETASAEDFAKERGQAARLSPRDPKRWRTLTAGATWSVGPTRVTVLWPERADATLSANDTSVILLLERGGFRALLLGDAEERPQQRLLDECAVPQLDVLKVAHHGSVNGSHEAALAAWAPKVALISVGAGNDFGHPAQRTLRALASVGALTRRTDREGDLTAEMRPPSSAAAASRGATVACATIEAARQPVAALPRTTIRSEIDGNLGTRRSQAGLPHLRRRGASPRARGPPSARAAVEGRRPRLQLRRVRR